MLTRRAEARAVALARDDGAGRPVAEQRRRDDVALRVVVPAEAQRAELDDEAEDVAFGIEPRHGAGTGEAEHAAAAAEPEDRQALDVAAKPHPLDEQRIEAGRRDAGGRDDNDRVERLGTQSRLVEALPGDRLEEIESAVDIDLVALFPARRVLVPIDRDAGIPRLDAGIVEDRYESLDFGFGNLAEQELEARPDVRLMQGIRRYGSRKSEHVWVRHC